MYFRCKCTKIIHTYQAKHEYIKLFCPLTPSSTSSNSKAGLQKKEQTGFVLSMYETYFFEVRVALTK